MPNPAISAKLESLQAMDNIAKLTEEDCGKHTTKEDCNKDDAKCEWTTYNGIDTCRAR